MCEIKRVQKYEASTVPIEMETTVQRGVVPLHWIPIVSSGLASVTIMVCYILAVRAGHVEPFPNTDITHCARYAPESFVFRMGLIPSCMIIAYMWYIIGAIHHPTQLPHTTYVGGLGAMLLIVASSVLESDGTTMWPLHVVCASSFFLLTIYSQCFVTLREYPEDWSKIAINGMQILLLLFDLVCGIFKLNSAYTKAVEWFLVGLIMLYFITFYPTFYRRKVRNTIEVEL